MAELPVNTIDREGTTADIDSLLVAAESAGDTFDATDDAFLVVYNGSAGMRTISLIFSDSVDEDGQNTANGGVVNKVVYVDLGKYGFFGPFPRTWYQDSDGMTRVEYDDAAGLQVGAFAVATS